jgi:uncharacterized membrane protein (DUF4010 family)
MVIATALLAWKERLAGFSMGLTEGELRSALLLAILALVIYPALPLGAIGPGHLIEPRAAWVTVILIAGIGFVNYILWKLYGARGIELSAFFGGLVNSNFTVIEMSTRVRESQGRFAGAAYRGILVAMAAMMARNATLLLILAPLAWLSAFGPLSLMIVTVAALVFRSYLARPHVLAETSSLQLELPFSLPVALRYGALFLALHIVGTLVQREFGESGFYIVTAIGGLLSSASAVAAAASMASQGAISPTVAGTGATIASLTSLVFSLSFVIRAGDRTLIVRLAWAMACVLVASAIGIASGGYIRPLAEHWIAIGQSLR